MSKPIDINKATLEEFTSITGIGEKRAQKILNKDLKLITCIPSTIWGIVKKICQTIKVVIS
jgi:ribosomal protein S13